MLYSTDPNWFGGLGRVLPCRLRLARFARRPPLGRSYRRSPRRLREPPRERPIAHRTAFPLVVLLLVFAGYVAYSQAQFGRRSEAIDGELAGYLRQRWERPPLRDVGRDGNAAAAFWEALGGFGGLRDRERDSLALSLYYGETLSALQRSLLDHESERLRKLRESGQFTWSMTELSIEQGLDLAVPDYPRVLDAALLLLAHGVVGGANLCLEVAADVVRLGQDLVPGAPLEAVSVAARLATLATRVASRCAGDAGRAEVARAAREFHALAKRPPAVGSAIESRDLLTLVELRSRADLFSPRSTDPIWTRLWKRPEVFDAMERLGEPSRWRTLASSSYPESLEAWRSEHQWRASSRLPLVSEESVGVLGFVYDDMRGQAVVRAAAVAFATLSERLRRGKIPERPEGIDDGALRDPFTDRQLRWRVAQDGSEITVWSVGEDLRDDKGIDDWTTEAPLDVAVHMAFRPLSEIESEEGKAPRRRRKGG